MRGLFRFADNLKAINRDGIDIDGLVVVIEEFRFDVFVVLFQRDYAFGSQLETFERLDKLYAIEFLHG